MIHRAGRYYDECKVFGGFGTKYAATQPTKECGSNPVPTKIPHKKQENHAIINNMVDDIQMDESKKVSAVNHNAPEFLENDYGENDLYLVENLSLDETK